MISGGRRLRVRANRPRIPFITGPINQLHVTRRLGAIGVDDIVGNRCFRLDRSDRPMLVR